MSKLSGMLAKVTTINLRIKDQKFHEKKLVFMQGFT